MEEVDRQAAMEAVSAEAVGQVEAEQAATETARVELARVELEAVSVAEMAEPVDSVLADRCQARPLAAQADMEVADSADTVGPAARPLVVAAIHQEVQVHLE